jgi:AAA15 family ATPase/GTPase
MRLKEISLKNFKRFTDLTIKDIPESAKLVLLIGANGSGKSSIFDAFEYYNNKNEIKDPTYYLKNTNEVEIEFTFNNGFLKTEKSLPPGNYISGMQKHFRRAWMGSGFAKSYVNPDDKFTSPFYGRSSSRIVPRIPSPDLQKSIIDDSDKPELFINSDIRFNTDIYEYIREINTAIRSPFFRGEKTDVPTITREYLTNLNESFKYILGENKTAIQLINIVDSIPGVPAKLIFQKGDSEINYDLLSHGEKQIVTLLLNFVVRNKYYQDTLYFIDEMDTHLETTIQKRLIENVVEKWIPGNSQLWTASHALGFIEYANKDENSVILDFDNLDFDVPQVIVPQAKYSSDVYEIAVSKEFLPSLFKGFDIVFVENTDRDLFAEVAIEKTLFIAEKNRDAVYHKVKDGAFKGIVDRDFLSDGDVVEIKKYYLNLRVLGYYSIENYLYHPDNLAEYFSAANKPFDKTAYTRAIADIKSLKVNDIILNIKSDRGSYPYFGEPKFTTKDLIELRNRFKNTGENETQTIAIRDALLNNNFETYYPHFSMKKYKGELPQLSNIKPIALAQTNWFKEQIQQQLS